MTSTRKNFKKSKGDMEQTAGNPYRSKVEKTHEGDMMRPRSWYAKGSAPEPSFEGRPAFDDGRMGTSS